MELVAVIPASTRDRHVKKHGDGQPLVDSSQDYVLLLGYENQTHTVLRFKRKLDTCDVAYDVPITKSFSLEYRGAYDRSLVR
uniref:DOMON domain-containing protein n=1 Tax=Anopheles albimanus TaxID=7167 RepID=A0A182FBG9_ANOAL